MTIQFASNNITHWPGANVDTNNFDSTRVPYSMRVFGNSSSLGNKFKPSSTNKFWVHCSILSTYSNFINNVTRGILNFYDENLNLLGYVSLSGGKLNITLFDDTASITSSDPNILFNENSINTLDIFVERTAFDVTGEIYLNNNLINSVVLGSNSGNFGNIAQLELSSRSTTNTGSSNYFSEIFISDESTINGRLNLLRPSASGAFNNFQGQIGTLADDDNTTGMTTVVADTRQTVTLTPYVGATNISNLIVTSLTTKGENAPSNLEHTIRLSGINYDSNSYLLGDTIQYDITDYELNPGTSSPWLDSDLTTIEAGFVSRA